MSELLPSEELKQSIVVARAGGATYPAIAKLYDLHVVTVRRYCRKAVEKGLVAAKAIRYNRIKKPRGLDKSTYDAKWIARVKASCVVDASGCWLWQRFTGHKGYGNTNYRDRSGSVHRRMYQIVNAVELRTEQFVCHRCDVRRCCNPDHLVLADNDWNMADKTAKGRHHEMKVTHCPRGHAYDENNTYRWPGGRARNCKLCSRIRQRIKSGWPEHLAISLDKVPAGYSWEDVCQSNS